MDEQQTPQAGMPIYQESSSPKNAKWLWLLVILIIIGGLVFAYVRGIGPFANFKSQLTEEASPSPEAELTNPSPEASASPTVNKSEAKIRVLNGGGKAGAGSAAKDFLETKGWKVTSVGNAASYDFVQTELRFKESAKQFEDALNADLSEKYSTKVSIKDLEASDSADIEVTVGSK